MKLWHKSFFIALLMCILPFFSEAREPFFPLERGEILLDQTIFSPYQAEIFLQKEEDFFHVLLHREGETWIRDTTEPIELPSANLGEEDESLFSPNGEEDYGFDLRGSSSLPARFYLRSDYLPTVKEQHEDSCVGFAAGYYLKTYQEAREFQRPPGENEDHLFSPSFLYNQINEGIDGGSTLGDAGKVLQQIGCATLRDFPYIPGDYQSQPGPEILRRAYPYHIDSYRILYTKYDRPEYMIRKTKEMISQQEPVIVGVNIGFKWKKPWQMPSGEYCITKEQYTSGGHAVMIIGYDDTLVTPDGVGAFRLVNSYGKEWADQGYCYISYEAFTAALRSAYYYQDAETVTESGIQPIEIALWSGESVRLQWQSVAGAKIYEIENQSGDLIAQTGETHHQITYDPQNLTSMMFTIKAKSDQGNILTSSSVEIPLHTIEKRDIFAKISTATHLQYQIGDCTGYAAQIIGKDGRIWSEKTEESVCAGNYEWVWDGKGKQGELAPPEEYRIRITPSKNPAQAKELTFTRKVPLSEVRTAVTLMQAKPVAYTYILTSQKDMEIQLYHKEKPLRKEVLRKNIPSEITVYTAPEGILHPKDIYLLIED